MSDETTGRAAPGEHLYVAINRVKAGKRELHEQLIHDILRPAAEQVNPELLKSVRFLHPIEPNKDGTYTYITLMDPVMNDADYSMENLMKQIYGEEKAQEYNQMWLDSLAEPQIAYEVAQSSW